MWRTVSDPKNHSVNNIISKQINSFHQLEHKQTKKNNLYAWCKAALPPCLFHVYHIKHTKPTETRSCEQETQPFILNSTDVHELKACPHRKCEELIPMTRIPVHDLVLHATRRWQKPAEHSALKCEQAESEEEKERRVRFVRHLFNIDPWINSSYRLFLLDRSTRVKLYMTSRKKLDSKHQ